VNFFHGRIDGAQLHVGDDRLHYGDALLPTGSEVVAFARPYELDISNDESGAGIPARVSRVRSIGAIARVELDGLSSVTGQHFEVELAQDRVDSLQILEGKSVRLVPSRMRVFERNKRPQEALP
jgi:sulfate transport system ATP-binding protein